jgi:hypothetical protein
MQPGAMLQEVPLGNTFEKKLILDKNCGLL